MSLCGRSCHFCLFDYSFLSLLAFTQATQISCMSRMLVNSWLNGVDWLVLHGRRDRIGQQRPTLGYSVNASAVPGHTATASERERKERAVVFQTRDLVPHVGANGSLQTGVDVLETRASLVPRLAIGERQ